jgi:hypothetical protein
VLPEVPAAERPAPLSLDDAAPLPPADRDRPRRRPGPPMAVVVLGIALLLLLVVIAFGMLSYRSGRIPESAWRSYTPPDNSFTVDLPGEPTAEPLNPLPGAAGGLGGELFTARGWYSGAVAWAGWRDVQPVVAAVSTSNPEQWMLYRPAIDAELERQKKLWNGTVTREATIKFENPLTVEVEMNTADGHLVERMYVIGLKTRSRLYVVGMRAPNLTRDSHAVKRLFGSFRVNPEGGGK